MRIPQIFEEQRYTSIFSGDEFFLADHIVQGQKILTGVAYLEMARAAVEQAVGSLVENQSRIQLNNIIWTRPIVVNGRAQAVHIGLFSEPSLGNSPDHNEDGTVRPTSQFWEEDRRIRQIQFEIYTELENGKGGTTNHRMRNQCIVHNKGIANFTSCNKPTQLDLAGLQRVMKIGHLHSKKWNDVLSRMGIHVAPGHKGFESAYIGENQMLTKLSLPSSLLETQDDYVLHTSLLDLALHASIGLFIEWASPSGSAYSLKPKALQPFPLALESLEIIKKCPALIWAWIRYPEGCGSEDEIQIFDLDLGDDQGEICVQMKGFSFCGLNRNNIPIKTIKLSKCHPPASFKDLSGPEASKRVFWGEGKSTKFDSSSPGNTQITSTKKIELKKRLETYLKDLFGASLKVNPARLDIDESLGEYGLDSIIALEINNRLEPIFSDLPKTLFFEFSTISELAGYFIKTRSEELLRLFFPVEDAKNGKRSSHPKQDQDQEKNAFRFHSSLKQISVPKGSRIFFRELPHENKLAVPSSGDKSQKSLAEIVLDAIETRDLYLDDILSTADIELIHPGINGQASKGIHTKPALEYAGPMLIHQDELKDNPELSQIIQNIDEQIPPITYERHLYPYYFLSSTLDRYIRLILDENNRVIIPFMPIHEQGYNELLQLSQRNNQQLLLFDGYHDWLDQDGIRMIPFGVFQNIDLNQFTLNGSKMRKLRYAVAKFKQSGEVKTEEYHSHAKLPFAEMKR